MPVLLFPNNGHLSMPQIPETFFVLTKELQSLALDVEIFKEEEIDE